MVRCNKTRLSLTPAGAIYAGRKGTASTRNRGVPLCQTEVVMDTIICSAAILAVALAANLDTLTRVIG